MVPFFSEHGSMLLVKQLQLLSEEHSDFLVDKPIYFSHRATFFLRNCMHSIISLSYFAFAADSETQSSRKQSNSIFSGS